MGTVGEVKCLRSPNSLVGLQPTTSQATPPYQYLGLTEIRQEVRKVHILLSINLVINFGSALRQSLPNSRSKGSEIYAWRM